MKFLHRIEPLYRRGLIAGAFFAAACSGDSPADPDELPVQYAQLVVTIGGLPNGAPAAVTVTGPGGFSRTLTATNTLTQLAAGNYTVDAADVVHEGSTYKGAPASQAYILAAGATNTTPNVSYAIATGGLSVTMAGLPQAAQAQIVITGPDSYSRTVSSATEIVGLAPGTYSLEAREVQTTSARYAPNYGNQTVGVVASTAPAVAHFVYTLSSGSIQVNITGLPQGANANVTVTGPGNYSQSVTTETVLENLVPGLYTITASNVIAGPLFVPAIPVQQVMVTASQQASVANVIYSSTGTALSVQINGLPTSLQARVTINGPNGFNLQLTSSQILNGIQPGTYNLIASVVNASCTTYSPTPPSQSVTVTAGQGTQATVTYSTGGGGVNFCIDGAYITQAIQTFDNTVPLIQGRAALLRVFVRASTVSLTQPQVRVRFYNQGGTLTNTITIPAPVAAVPTAIDEGTLGTSWNAQLPGSFLQPGMRLLVDVDPTNAIAEGNEADNVFPGVGIPIALDVRTVAPLNVTIVPVTQAVRGDTARVTDANKANFLLPMERMFPVATINADVHAAYTYSGGELASGGTNWTQLLSEINALRVAEATGKMYYGIVRVGYTSGVAGLGYIGVPSSIGWDYQPSGTEVMAHELGHNFGRLHAPCGSPSGVDGSYPYSGAQIGVFGYDITSGSVKTATTRDLMSYCDPPWISDYTYNAILNWRASHPMVATAQPSSASSQHGLLVWGRIENGQVVLEPGIEVDAPPSLPARSGPHRIEAFGPAGETLFSLSFSGDRIDHAQDPNDQSFAFVVPTSQLRGVSLNRLRLSALGRQVEQRSSGGGAAPTAQRMARGRVRVEWNHNAARVALIKDMRTGKILSFARGGAINLSTASDDLEITVSDGVKSVRSRVRPQ
jgi:hypothetical protein